MNEPLSRKERERLARRQAMLDAASAVFSERGYTDATLDEIAQRAEFGKGTLYNYFEGGKEGILYALLDDFYAESERLIETAFREHADGERWVETALFECIRSLMAYAEDRSEQFLILLRESQRMMLSEDESRAAYFRDQQGRLIDALLPHLQRAADEGLIKDVHPEILAHTIFGNINGVQLHRCVTEDEKHRHADLLTPDSTAHFLTTMLLYGLSTERPPNISNDDASDDTSL